MRLMFDPPEASIPKLLTHRSPLTLIAQGLCHAAAFFTFSNAPWPLLREPQLSFVKDGPEEPRPLIRWTEWSFRAVCQRSPRVQDGAGGC